MRMIRSDALPNASRNLQAEAEVGAPEFSGVPAYNPYLGKTSVHSAVVLDPFIGGRTSLVESMRCRAVNVH